MLKLIIKLLVSIALIIIIFHKVDFNQFKDLISKVGVVDFLGLSAILMLSQLISSFRWKLVIKSLNDNIGFLKLFKLYLMGMFANLFLPSIIGGDAIKGYILSKRIGLRKAISSIFLERYNGLLALLLLSLISVSVFFNLFGIKLFLLVVGVNIFAFISVYALRYFKHDKISSFYQDIERFHKSSQFLPVSVLSFIIQIMNIFIYVSLGWILGFKVNLAYYVAFIPIITLISFLPISFNGVGVREFSFVYFFKFAGLTPAEAVSLSLVAFFVSVFCSLIGGIFYLYEGKVIKETKSFHKQI